MQHYFQTPGRALTPWWPHSQWTGPSPETLRVANAFTFETDDALWIDARVGGLFYWATFVPKKLGGKAFACAGPCDKATNKVGLSSLDKSSMKQNGDGSVDLYFGPKASDGLEANSIPTGGKPFFLIFRLYGPE